MRSRSCLLRTRSEDFSGFDQAACLQWSDSKRNWLLIGDSHAADLWTGLARVNPEVNLLQATATGCKPVLDAEGESQCTDLMQFMFGDFVPRHRFDTILLSARWNSRDLGPVRATVRALLPFARRVVVLGPRVEYRHDLPWLLTASVVGHDGSIVERFRSARQLRTDRLFAERLRADGIGYVSLYHAICPGERCRVTDEEGLPLAFDYGHLTVRGATFVAQQIRKSGAL
jgi:hypothetical protein